MAGEPQRVYVTNLNEVRQWVRKIHPDLVPVLRDELKSAVAKTVVPAVQKNVPVRSGRAKASVRSVAGGNTVYVAAGSAKAPHFGWLDFGGKLAPEGRRRNTQQRPVIKTGRYLYPGITASSTALVEAAGRAVDTVLNRP